MQDRFDGKEGFHAHFLCTSCGELQDINPAPDEIINDIETMSGQQISLFGICSSGTKN